MGDLSRLELVVSGERVDLPGEPVAHPLGGKRDVAPEQDMVGPREGTNAGRTWGWPEPGSEVEALQVGQQGVWVRGGIDLGADRLHETVSQERDASSRVREDDAQVRSSCCVQARTSPNAARVVSKG
jgi:hypothetical protein